MTKTEDIIWNGRTFRRYPEHENRSHRVYFMSSSPEREYLHRAVYRHHHGPIPDGWHVHHKDHDPLNNDPSNLEAISPSQHAEHHGGHLPQIPKVCPGCAQAFIGNRPWAKWCSPACKMQARRDAGLVKPKARKGPFLEVRSCEHCTKTYEAKRPWARFCSPACKQRAMRGAAA